MSLGTGWPTGTMVPSAPPSRRKGYPQVRSGSLDLQLMALAPVRLRLGSLCLSITTTGFSVRRVPFLAFQIPPPTGHACDATDDQDNREETEDQDVEHGPLDHGRLGRER
jgi:hypothetical protein